MQKQFRTGQMGMDQIRMVILVTDGSRQIGCILEVKYEGFLDDLNTLWEKRMESIFM